MSVIERVLNRLEEKLLVRSAEVTETEWASLAPTFRYQKGCRGKSAPWASPKAA